MDSSKAQLLQEFLARHQPGEAAVGTVLKTVLDEAAATVAAALEAANVDALILKGPALDALLYREGEGRRYVDIDLLVSPADIRAAEEVLENVGYQNAGAHLGIDDVGGVVHAETWIRLRPDTLTPQIELHRWFPGATAPADEVWPLLWRSRTQISLAGGRIWVLRTEGQALQLALHLAQHGPRYARGAWELRLALERWPLPVWRVAAELAEQTGATEAFATGLRLVAAPEHMMHDLALPSAVGLAWDAEHREEFPRGIYHLEAIREARRLDRVRVLRRALIPSTRWIVRSYGLDDPGRLQLTLAYARHLLRAPWWAARAALFSRRRRRAVDG